VTGVDESPTPPSVLVVGGGVSGLAAAHRLRTRLGDAAAVTVVESARSLGGKLAAVELGGRRVDVGAEAFLVRRPEAAARIAELGLTDDLVHPGVASSLVRAGGANHRLPGRTVLGVPSDPGAVSELLSASGRAALAAEEHLPAVAWTPGDDASVGALLRARTGDEVVDRLVDPLLGGVYAGRPDTLGLRATIPALAEALDAGAGSVLAAARAGLPAAPPEGTAPAPVFGTLRHGLADLPGALALAARAEIVLGATVTALDRVTDGWEVTLDAGGTRSARRVDAVVLAVPAPALRRLLAGLAPHAAAAAGEIELASSVVVALAVPASADLGANSGVLLGAGERRPDGRGWTVKALTFSSVKWPHLAPAPVAPGDDATAVLRASIGRHGDTGTLQRDDDDLLAATRDDLRLLTGLDAEPVETAVMRWGGGLPQYGVGHTDRVAAIEWGVARLPGLAVAGAALHGVGVPACLATGDAAAERVAAHLAALAPARGSGTMEPWPG